MAKDTVIIVRGELNWAKITGDARPYTGDAKYDKGPLWSVDITPDAASRETLAKLGLDRGGRNGTGKLREPKGKDNRKESFLTLKVLEARADGKKNDAPDVVDASGRAWGDTLLGNGTIADIKIKVKDYGSSSEKGFYFQKARILKHIPYEGDDFEPLSEDDEFFGASSDEWSNSSDTDTEASEPQAKADSKGKAPNPDALDDDVPF